MMHALKLDRKALTAPLVGLLLPVFASAFTPLHVCEQQLNPDTPLNHALSLPPAELRAYLEERWDLNPRTGPVAAADSEKFDYATEVQQQTWDTPMIEKTSYRIDAERISFDSFFKQVQAHLAHSPEESTTFEQLGLTQLQLPNPKSLFILATESVLHLISSQKILLKDAIFPALGFYSTTLQEMVYLNPILDGWPTDDYELALFFSQMPHGEWVQSIASGRQPLSFGHRFFMHDFVGHFTDLVQDPELMKWTLRNQSQIDRIENHTLDLSFNQDPSQKKILEAYFNRNAILREFCAIPKRDLSSDLLEGLLQNDPLKAGPYIADHFENSLALHGGALRDHHKITFGVGIYKKLEAIITAVLHRGYSAPKDHDPTATLFFETLWGLGKEIQVMNEVLNPRSSPTLNAWERAQILNLRRVSSASPANYTRARAFNAELIRRFQAGLKAGIDLKITMPKILQESMNLKLPNDSKTSQFFKSFATPDTRSFELLVHTQE